MNVLLVSECSKRALTETRRIIDQFAERKGCRTWQTAITEQGLLTLRKMLRKSARRGTAVACSWIRPHRTELLWIVGNIGKFDQHGRTPTNTTSRDILRADDEDLWRTGEDIAVLAGIAGLFHDFGKSNKLFQTKLKPTSKRANSCEPFRHEWISLRLFQAFVGQASDQEWLEQLLRPELIDEAALRSRIVRDKLAGRREALFEPLPPLARIVAWLILSHHRLPEFHKQDQEASGSEPRLANIDEWLFKDLDPSWNSPQCQSKKWQEAEFDNNWNVDKGLPTSSRTWQKRAVLLADRALRRHDLISGKKDWMADAFSMHIARMALMLGDHVWSAHAPSPAWQDKKWKKLWANTDRKTRQLRQQLDEHLIGVAHNADRTARSLPQLRRILPALARHKKFRQRSGSGPFAWQDKSFDLACAVRQQARQNGFFGVNMASTGCGKTFANARIMYGLADERLGCRFSVALGLRTLTLQTGDALRERLGLQKDELAVLIGSQAVRQLHELASKESMDFGSESEEDLLADVQHVLYEGSLADGRISSWLQQTPKLHQLVSAPILVSTIDHLIPATEGGRGGRQIAPMLRLLTSDLVLDEPDDFGMEDLPALCRLVHWAGLLGSKVLISSATLTPALTEALFCAYLAGRSSFEQNCGEQLGRQTEVCCAWFDEERAVASNHAKGESFAKAHGDFVGKRVERLRQGKPLRRAELLPMDVVKLAPKAAVQAIAEKVHGAMFDLHARHGKPAGEGRDKGKRISVGLIRMANINPLAAMAERLLGMSPPVGHHVHFCVYHSQHPLAVRSEIERMLDEVLDRHEPQLIWQHPCIRQGLDGSPEEHHLFVVLASPVAEVGRDHDYDWAIAEPSSMRSLIQLAGRIQRHRRKDPAPASPNLLVLSRNFRSLTGKRPAYCKPGFETEKGFSLASHDLHDLLDKEQLDVVTSIPRIKARVPLNPQGNLVDLEHQHMRERLLDGSPGKVHAAMWWERQPHWCHELQRRTPFRNAEPDNGYVFFIGEEGDDPEFRREEENGSLTSCKHDFERIRLEPAPGVSLWGCLDVAKIFAQLSEELDMTLADVSQKFGCIRLPDRADEDNWLYHPALGVHRKLKQY